MQWATVPNMSNHVEPNNTVLSILSHHSPAEDGDRERERNHLPTSISRWDFPLQTNHLGIFRATPMTMETPIYIHLVAPHPQTSLVNPFPSSPTRQIFHDISPCFSPRCSPGTWSDAMGASSHKSCQSCPIGSYSDVPGSRAQENVIHVHRMFLSFPFHL